MPFDNPKRWINCPCRYPRHPSAKNHPDQRVNRCRQDDVANEQGPVLFSPAQKPASARNLHASGGKCEPCRAAPALPAEDRDFGKRNQRGYQYTKGRKRKCTPIYLLQYVFASSLGECRQHKNAEGWRKHRCNEPRRDRRIFEMAMDRMNPS